MKSKTPWWKGKHGEWYCGGPINPLFHRSFWPLLVETAIPHIKISPFIGCVSLLTGSLLFISVILRLGANFSALPIPNQNPDSIDYDTDSAPPNVQWCYFDSIWAFVMHSWLAIGTAIV